MYLIVVSLLLLSTTVSSLSKGSLRHELIFDLESRLTCFWETLGAEDRLRVSVISMEDKTDQLQLRVTSPSGSLSDWDSGDKAASLSYNLTESGVYEFCLYSTSKTRVSLNIFAYNEKEMIEGVSSYTQLVRTGTNLKSSVVTLNERLYSTLHSIKYSTYSMARDEKLQKKNTLYIERYTISFIILNLIIAVVQVVVIRRFFKDINTGRVRI